MHQLEVVMREQATSIADLATGFKIDTNCPACDMDVKKTHQVPPPPRAPRKSKWCGKFLCIPCFGFVMEMDETWREP